MVGGDRRSPPRYKAKGGGTRGKGSGSGDGLGASGDSKLKIGGVKLTANNGEKFQFGSCPVEDNLQQATDTNMGGDLLRDEVSCDLLKDDSCMAAKVDFMEVNRIKIGLPPTTPTPLSCSSTSWALEVEACEALEQKMAGSGEVKDSVCAMEHSRITKMDERQCSLRSSLTARAKSGEAKESEMLQAADSYVNDRILDPCTTGMDCDDHLQGAIHVSLNGVNGNESCWKSEKFGKFACADSSFSHSPHNCTQGVCLLASTGQCAAINDVETEQVQGGISAPNCNSISATAAVVSLNNETTRTLNDVGNPVKQNREIPKPILANAWKKPIHVKVNSLELGEITKNGRSVALDRTAYGKNKCRLEKGLVGKLIGRRLPLYILDRELSRRWGHVGGFRTVLIGGDCFLCIFETVEARDNILMGGPWQIMGHIIGMDKWTPEFNPDSLKGLSSPVWVRLPRLPLLFWDNITIGRIATMLGEPLWIDALTTEWGRSEYARICVRLDLSKKLPTGVWIEGEQGDFFQPVEYEGVSMLCFHCGIVGHKVDCCPNLLKTKLDHPLGDLHNKNLGYATNGRGRPSHVQGEATSMKLPEPGVNNEVIHQEQPPPVVRDTSTSGDGDYGPWILVTKRKRPPTKSRNSASKNLIGNATTKIVSIKSPQVITPTDSLVENSEAMAHTVMKLDKPNKESQNLMDSAEMTQHTPDNAASILSHSRSGKSRISKAHFEKELLQLGPIALKSRKRKKHVSVAGVKQCFEDFTSKVDTSENACGGDASPSGGE